MKMSWIRKIEINGKHIKSVDDFHDEIEGFSNTDGYGRNLDALYDELTQSDDLIVLENTDDLLKNLGSYGDKIIKTLNDAAEDNERLTIIYK